MRKIFILQNSQVSFGLNAENIYNPKKYDLYLIANTFANDIITKNKQTSFYKKTLITDDFSLNHIISIINTHLGDNDFFDVITNSEETMPICGRIRLHFGLDQSDYSRFYNKNVMKLALKNNTIIKLPNYTIFHRVDYLKAPVHYLKTITKNMKFPLFIKPTMMYSSMNLKKIHHFDELKKWADNLATDDEYEIDEFIEGTMYHCDSYIKNKKVLFTFVSMNSRPCYDFTIGKIKGTIVLPENHPDYLLLSKITEETLKKLGPPKAGVTHLELIKTVKNEVYFIEIAHRAPGCLIPKMYQTHAAIDTISSHFLLQIDESYYPKPEKITFAAWACYPKKPGKVLALNTLPFQLTSDIEIEWHVKLGDEIKNFSQFGRDYTGTIFLKNPDFNKLYEEFLTINTLDLCIIDDIPQVLPN